MSTKTASVTALILTVSLAAAWASQDESWVARSNRNSEVLLEVMARFNPEGAAFMGIDGLDEDILSLDADRDERQSKALEIAVAELRSRLGIESDARVRLDLEILIESAEPAALFQPAAGRLSGRTFAPRRTEFAGEARGRRGSAASLRRFGGGLHPDLQTGRSTDSGSTPRTGTRRSVSW